MRDGIDSNSFALGCQRALLGAFLGLSAGPAGALPAAPPSDGSARLDSGPGLDLPGLSGWRLGGSLSVNWRNVGPREPGFETQIQNEVYLADIYFDVHGPVLDGVPFMLEFHMPTGSQGQPSLYQMNFQYSRLANWDFKLGKFLVPFGRYNELYRPDMFLTVTRPLLYASPDSLDLVVRINSPRPPFSSGYTDIGARASYYPPDRHWLLPSEVTFFVINGLSESTNRQRTFPAPENLGIPPPPANGVSPDFGHENNNLADNNNDKVLGARLVHAFGSLDLPWPIPEGKRDLNGLSLGISGMKGAYNLEGDLNYGMVGADLGFEYQGVHFSAEYMYSVTQFRSPIEVFPGSTTLAAPTQFALDDEIIHGYYLQASFPILRKPRWGKRLTGVLVYNRIFRRGPRLDLLTNQLIDGDLFPSVAAYNTDAPRLSRLIAKTTFALNYRMTEHFTAKFDYSYWDMRRSSTLTGTRDIYQGAASIILNF